MSEQATDGWPTTRRTGAFERRLGDALDDALGPGRSQGPLLLACSGGPDSTALLVASARVLGGTHLVAAHFDHVMRSAHEREADRAFLAEIAARLGVRCAVGSVTERPTSEDGARRERYRWLAEACLEAGARFCATGHTEDDQAETVLLRLIRGAGLDGAAGMRPRAPWPVDDAASLEVVRPLLARSRGEIDSYLSALGIDARDDATNADTSFARNRVRRRVVPELRAINPAATAHLAAFARRAGADAAVLRALGRSEFARIGSIEDGAARLDRRELAALEAGAGPHVLRAAAGSVGLELDSGQSSAVLALAARRGATVSLRRGRARSDERNVWLEPEQSGGRG
jgi:tRNA(Ile)-lysidine synthase